MRQYTVEDVDAALRGIDVLQVVADGLLAHERGLTQLPDESVIRWTAPDGGPARSIVMHAAVPGETPVVGMKVINGAINNPTREMPRASGLIMLFDPLTAQITDVMPAARISALRTAAVSTLTVRSLTSEVGTLGLLGAGVLAQTHVELLLAAGVDVRHVLVRDVVPGRAQTLLATLNVDGEAVADAKEVVRRSSVCVAATTVTKPYVPLRWLTKGSVFVNVSLDDLDRDALLGAERLFVDDRHVVAEDRSRLLGRLCAEGLVSNPPPEGGRAITGTIGELLLGRHAPLQGDERVVVNPFGLGISDVAIAAAVRAAIPMSDRTHGAR